VALRTSLRPRARPLSRRARTSLPAVITRDGGRFSALKLCGSTFTGFGQACAGEVPGLRSA
jgi:hypothetical protein